MILKIISLFEGHEIHKKFVKLLKKPWICRMVWRALPQAHMLVFPFLLDRNHAPNISFFACVSLQTPST
jgi:hypothetical protein